ncbi:MAG: PEP-CTERM sorting domain-containing protein [Armatimonas sp.]
MKQNNTSIKSFVPALPMTFGVGLIACSLLLSAPAQAQIFVSAYLSAPNTQTVPGSISGPVSETFDAQSVGAHDYTDADPFASAIGNYSGRFAVVGDDQYGTGTGNYFAIGAQSGSSSPVTLTFASPVRYFGMSYNAGDSQNGFSFYDSDNNFVGRYSTATLISVLHGGVGTVTALDNSVYDTSRYYGKPNGAGPTNNNTGQNSGEPYAFLNFFVDGGGISKIVFDNSNTQGSGFESDNHTISLTAQTPVGHPFVFVGTASAAPEPGSVALLAITLPLAGTFLARRKRSL